MNGPGHVIHCAVNRSMKLNNILEAIGHTPLIRLNRMARDSRAEVYVKADYLNPGGSVKDRIGINMIFTITDKQSKEKIDLLKAFGAEVIVCPTAVEPDDPRSYYSVAKKLAAETPNCFYANQYHNPANPEAHYVSTG